MAEKKNTECWLPKEIDGKIAMMKHHKPKKLPNTILCEIRDNDKTIGYVKELTVLRSSEDNTVFTGKIIIRRVVREISLVSDYTMVLIMNLRILRRYSFRFVGELPTCFQANEAIGYPEHHTFPVEEGKEYEFFAREI